MSSTPEYCYKVVYKIEAHPQNPIVGHMSDKDLWEKLLKKCKEDKKENSLNSSRLAVSDTHSWIIKYDQTA